MKKLILPVIVCVCLLIPSVAKAAGPTYGKSAPFYGGENTYGYSWAGYDGKWCTTTTTIGPNSWTEPDWHWAQTEGCKSYGKWNIYESHSFKDKQ